MFSMRLISFFLLVIFSAPVAAFADPYLDLQTGADGFEHVLKNDIEDHTAEQLEMKLQAGDEFFPESGSGSSSSRRGGTDISTNQFVTFRLDGVPYVLKDVPSIAWFAPYVRDVAGRGIVSGYRDAENVPTGIFGPERSVSIEELAKMSIVAAGLNPGECWEAPKNAGAQKSWSAAYIRCAELHNLAVYADGTVDILRPATRAEVVMTVLQAFGVQLRDSPPANVNIKDVTASTLFSSAIYTALGDGIVSGDSDSGGNLTGRFRPESFINRAEVSKIISLAVQLYGND